MRVFRLILFLVPVRFDLSFLPQVLSANQMETIEISGSASTTKVKSRKMYLRAERAHKIFNRRVKTTGTRPGVS